jgi:hypothetical protein
MLLKLCGGITKWCVWMYVKELSSGSVNGSHNMMGMCHVPLANLVDDDKLGGTHTLLRGYTMPFCKCGMTLVCVSWMMTCRKNDCLHMTPYPSPWWKYQGTTHMWRFKTYTSVYKWFSKLYMNGVLVERYITSSLMIKLGQIGEFAWLPSSLYHGGAWMPIFSLVRG